MKKFTSKIVFLLIVAVFATACTKDLDSKPIDPNVVTSATVYDNPAAYKEALAKLYAGLSLTGQQGATGQADISGIDEGFSAYLRQYWCAQELSTDEAVIGSSSGNIREYHYQNWSTSNAVITALYNRLFYQISICNEYIRVVTPKLNDISGTLKTDVTHYLAEARFLRALAYYHALDMFGNVPLVTDADPIGKFFPKQVGKKALFDYIQAELLAIDGDLVNARANEYARADKACAWTLLTKLYLNAEIYIGEKKYTECINYSNKVIAAGFTLHPTYRNLFLADNNLNNPEIIFPVTADGIHTRTLGGANWVIFTSVGGSMNPADFGITSGYAGSRTTKNLVAKFSDISGATDKRPMFYTSGQTLEIDDISKFTQGYAVAKFRNVTSTGAKGSSLAYVDTDYPLFRLADVYLTYAEAVLRGGAGGDQTQALTYINRLRQRAYTNATGNIAAANLTLDFILDERARELYWEGYRRTDLIRYGRFTNGDYVWPWKGNALAGIKTDAHFNVYPIPSSELGANPEIIQSAGY